MNTISEIENPSLFNSKANHILQSWQWGDFRAETQSVKKVLRLGTFADQSLTNVYQIFIHRLPKGPLTIAYLPRSTVPDQQTFEVIKKLCQKERAIFLKLEPLTHLGEKTILHSRLRNGEPILAQHTIYIDLRQSEDKLLSNMHEKTRYNLRLSERKGVVVKEESTQDGLEKFIRLHEATQSRQNYYSHTPAYYRQLWQSLTPFQMVHILNAYIADSSFPVATMMFFHFKEFLYYPYGGSNNDYRNLMAPYSLYWAGLKLGKRLGCNTFDLWSSYKNHPVDTDPWWGIYRIKSGFGGKHISFPPAKDVPLSPWYQPLILGNKVRWAFLKLRRRSY